MTAWFTSVIQRFSRCPIVFNFRRAEAVPFCWRVFRIRLYLARLIEVDDRSCRVTWLVQALLCQVSPVLGKYWANAYRVYKEALNGPEFASWFATFAPGGRAPKIGEVWASPDHAATLRSIAETEAESFYRGELAEKIAAFSKQYGGFLAADDLAEYEPEWVEPISVSYRGYEVWEIPPNGQGLVALMAINIMNGFDVPSVPDVETHHR